MQQNQGKMGKSREVGARQESGSMALGLTEKGSSEVSAAAEADGDKTTPSSPRLSSPRGAAYIGN